MTRPSAALSDKEKEQVRIDAALLEYYQRVDRGEAIDREAFLASRPEIADQLRECLDAAELLESIAAAASNPSGMHGSNLSGGSSLTRFARAAVPAPSGIKLTTQPVSTEQFVVLLRKSGLVSRADIKRILHETQQELTKVPKHARVLAERFVRAGLLTSWQQTRLLEGKESGYFVGGYKLLAHIGTGGMGSVYRAEHMHLRRLAAVKILSSSRANRASYLERFHREARLIASLNHPNIVRAFDVDNDGPLHFLAMEYVDGINLQQLVLDVGFLSFRQAADYTLQTALGLDQAHRQGVIHRDVKPSNLLVDRNGVVKILDMGLAFLDDTAERSLTIEYDEKVLGTADYMAPEQAIDSHQVDHRADIYSLGCTMYFLLTGHPPFAQGPVAKRLLEHQTAEPDDIRLVRPDAPAELIAICKKMMAKKPEDRYFTADEVCEELERFLTDWSGQEAIVAPDLLPELSETDELAFFLAERLETGTSWTTTDDPLLDVPRPPWWHNSTLWATAATLLVAAGLLFWLMQGSGKKPPLDRDVSAATYRPREDDPFGIPQFDILDRAVVSNGDLGYDMTSTGSGVVLNQLREPITKKATFVFQLRATSRKCRNGFLALGTGPTDAETIKCGAMFSGNQLVIYEGKYPSKALERLRVSLPVGRTYSVEVKVNLPQNEITMKFGGHKLTKKLKTPIKAIHYYGYASIGSNTEFSEVEISTP